MLLAARRIVISRLSVAPLSVKAKGKGGKGGKEEKGGGGGGGGGEHGDPSEFDPKNKLEPSMKSAIQHLKNELAKLRGGRADPALLENILVPSKTGGKAPLSQVAQIGARENQLLVNVLDPELVPLVEKSIRDGGGGFNPIVEGHVVRVPIPKLSTEVRENLTKMAASQGETVKTQLRSFRRNSIQDMKRASLSQDDSRRLEKQIDAIVSKYEEEVNDVVAAKTKELKTR